MKKSISNSRSLLTLSITSENIFKYILAKSDGQTSRVLFVFIVEDALIPLYLSLAHEYIIFVLYKT